MTVRAKVAVFLSAGDSFDLRTMEIPALAEGEVLVRVRLCTICVSDLHTHSGRRESPSPAVLGHEILGDVSQVAGEVYFHGTKTPIRCGDRVTWSISVGCGTCFFCTHDLPQKCSNLFKYGHEALDEAGGFAGGLAEYCHLKTGTPVFSVPEGLADEVAAPANCAFATVAAALRDPVPVEGDVVLVMGAGLLGLAASAQASTFGARTIVVDPNPERRAWAHRFGAEEAVAPDDVPAVVASMTEGRGADLSIEVSGSVDALELALDQLRVGGVAVVVGCVMPVRFLALDPERLVRRVQTLRGLHNYTPADLGRALNFLEEHGHKFPFDEVVAGIWPLEEVDEAFQAAREASMLRVGIAPRGSGG